MQFEAQYLVLFDRVQIRYYGIIIVAAMLVAAWVATRLAKRDGRNEEHISGALTWAIIPAIIGARLAFILLPPEASVAAGRDTAWFLQNFFDFREGAIAIWSGGLNIFGAVIGGGIAALLYFSRWHGVIAFFFSAILYIIFYPVIWLWSLIQWSAVGRGKGEPYRLPRVTDLTRANPTDIPQDARPWLDIAGVSLPLGQAIGRWANYINQELYGVPTDLPWGIAIPREARVGQFQSEVLFPVETTRFHPLFLYESLWNLLAFIVLLTIWVRFRHRLLKGDIFLLYVIQYSVIRFLLETIRVQTTIVSGINLWQAFSVVTFVIALAILIVRHLRAPRPTVTANRPA